MVRGEEESIQVFYSSWSKSLTHPKEQPGRILGPQVIPNE